MNLMTQILATAVKPGDLPRAPANEAALTDILTITFMVIGALALLMITVSGLRYILAGSDAQKVSKAKNGIIYSLVGLLIAITAQAIVYFMVERL